MQKAKKLLAMLIACVMSLALILPASVSAVESFSDLQNGHKYYDAIHFLATQGVIDGFDENGVRTFQPEGEVTRAQFAKMMAVALEVDNIPLSANGSGFTDVASDHWGAQYIAVMASMGIVNGMGDGTFEPESQVTYEQAIKMCVVALNYQDIAMQEGGWPTGYTKVGSNIGLGKKIDDGVYDQAALRGTIAQLIYNMLYTPLMGDDGKVDSNDTLISRRGTEKQNGQVTAIRDVSIDFDRESTCLINEIEIFSNGLYEKYDISKVFPKGQEEARAYLGRQIQFYYTEPTGGNGKVLESISVQPGKNETTVIDMEDITHVEDASIEYYDSDNNDELETAHVQNPGSVYIMYNGKPTNKRLSQLADEFKQGTVTLLDSARNGAADVVFVSNYDNYYVNNIDTKNYRVYDTYVTSKSVTLDPDDNKSVITFTKDGKPAEFRDIAKGYMMSVAQSDPNASGKRIVEVLISTQIVRGTIDERSTNSDKVTINGKEYKLAESYKKAQVESSDKAATLSLNTSGTFYLDAFGKIGAVDVTAAKSYEYGYLTAVNNELTTDGHLQIRLMSLTGSGKSATTLTVDSNVRLDGESMRLDKDDYDKFVDRLKTSAALQNPVIMDDSGTAIHTPDNTNNVSQIIKYTTNSSRGNRIDKIVTSATQDNGDPENSLFISDYSASPLKYTGSNSFDGKVRTASDAKVLFVPENRTAYADYRRGLSGLSRNVNYHLLAIDSVNGGAAKAIIVFKTAEVSDITPESLVVLVGSGFGVESRDDMDTRYFEGYEYGKTPTKRFYESSDLPISNLGIEVGDVIRVELDSDRYITNYEKVNNNLRMLADANNLRVYSGSAADGYVNGLYTQGDNVGQSNAEFSALIGTALSNTGDTLTVVPAFVTGGELDDTNALQYEIDSSVEIVRFNINESTASRQFETGLMAQEIYPFNDVGENASKVFLYTKSNSVQLIVIYNDAQ